MLRTLIILLMLVVCGAATANAESDLNDLADQLIAGFEKAEPPNTLRSTFDSDMLLIEAIEEIDWLDHAGVTRVVSEHSYPSQLRRVYSLYADVMRDDDNEAQSELITLARESSNWTVSAVANRQLAQHALSKSDEIAYTKYANAAVASIPLSLDDGKAAYLRYLSWGQVAAAHTFSLDAELTLHSIIKQLGHYVGDDPKPSATDIFYNPVYSLSVSGEYEPAKRLLDFYDDVTEANPDDERAKYHHVAARYFSMRGESAVAVSQYKLAVELADSPGFRAVARGQLATELAKIGRSKEARDILSGDSVVQSNKRKLQTDAYLAASDGRYRAAYGFLDKWVDIEVAALNRRLSRAARTAREAMSVNAEVVDARLAKQEATAEAARMEQRLAEERARRNRIVAMLSAMLAAVLLFSTIYIFRLLKEEKRLRREADRLSEDAQAASRAKQQFISMMSHEFRTPLNHIIPVVDSYLAHTKNDPKGQVLGRIIDNASQRILRMVDEINTIAGGVDMLHGNTEPFPVTRFAQSLEEEKVKGYVLTPELQLYVEYADGLPSHLAGDPDKIDRILVALVENGMKYGGAHPVRLRVDFEAPEEAGERGQLVLQVTDQGGGMTQDTLTRIMQPFMQGDMGLTRAQDGLGLGLNLVSLLCRSLGGRFIIDGNHYTSGKRGTQVTVRIPVYASNPQGTWDAKPESDDARRVREAVEAKTDARLGLRPRRKAA